MLDCYDRQELFGKSLIANREDPSMIVERMINWTNVLGYEKRPSDICAALYRENQEDGPYSWDLMCKVRAIAGVIEDIKSNRPPDAVKLLDRWFSMRIGSLIKKDKLEGVEPPKPKGFFARLFG